MYVNLSFILLGLCAGTFAGLLGIGGGVVVVFGLASILELSHTIVSNPLHIAIATSLTIMIFTTASSLWGHAKSGFVRWDILKRLLPCVFAGVFIGACIDNLLSHEILTLVFGIFVLLISFKMLFFSNLSAKNHHESRLLHFPYIDSAGLIIGIKSGLLGTGGGIITIPLLSFSGVDMRQCIATSAGTSFAISIIGSLSYFIISLFHHHAPSTIYWPAVLFVSIGSIMGSQIGCRLSHKLSTKLLKKIFALLLLFIGIKSLMA